MWIKNKKRRERDSKKVKVYLIEVGWGGGGYTVYVRLSLREKIPV